MRRRGASRAAPGSGEIGWFRARPRKIAPPRGQGGLSTAPKTRPPVRHSSRRRADDLRSSREVARAAAGPLGGPSFHKQAVSTPLPDPKTAVDRPAVSSPTEAQEVLRIHPRDGGPRATRRAGCVRQGGGNLPRWRRRAAVTLATTTEFRFTSLCARKRRTGGNF